MDPYRTTGCQASQPDAVMVPPHGYDPAGLQQYEYRSRPMMDGFPPYKGSRIQASLKGLKGHAPNSKVGIPVTFVFIRNTPPDCGYFLSEGASIPMRAVVMNNSSMSGPPKTQEVTCKAGTPNCSSSAPFGVH